MKSLRVWRSALLCLSLFSAPVCLAQQQTNEPKPAAAQPAQAANRVDSLVTVWTRAREWTKAYLDKMPEEAYGFKPVPEVRSFAEQMLHLAGANFGYGGMAFRKATPYKPQDFTKDEYKSKAMVSKVVMESYEFVIDALKGLSDAKLDEMLAGRGGAKLSRAEVLLNAFEHQTHHRGQTTLYLRMKGVVPPPEPF